MRPNLQGPLIGIGSSLKPLGAGAVEIVETASGGLIVYLISLETIKVGHTMLLDGPQGGKAIGHKLTAIACAERDIVVLLGVVAANVNYADEPQKRPR